MKLDIPLGLGLTVDIVLGLGLPRHSQAAGIASWIDTGNLNIPTNRIHRLCYTTNLRVPLKC
uniref:Uncharacterized protein n=1 Tax=Romanomermis culicivorax TaxID=13658 RepID=A0A915J415_ROMCU